MDKRSISEDIVRYLFTIRHNQDYLDKDRVACRVEGVESSSLSGLSGLERCFIWMTCTITSSETRLTEVEFDLGESSVSQIVNATTSKLSLLTHALDDFLNGITEKQASGFVFSNS